MPLKIILEFKKRFLNFILKRSKRVFDISKKNFIKKRFLKLKLKKKLNYFTPGKTLVNATKTLYFFPKIFLCLKKSFFPFAFFFISLIPEFLKTEKINQLMRYLNYFRFNLIKNNFNVKIYFKNPQNQLMSNALQAMAVKKV